MLTARAHAPEPQVLARPEEQAIARSVLYASLFDYPLTLAQLRRTLVESIQTPTEILRTYAASESLRAIVEYRDGFFFPRGRHSLVAERRKREEHSLQFLERHRLILSLVCALPYVRMVALSGSVAHLNLERGGDLDLFIVVKGHRVWSIAVAVVVLAKLVGRRKTLCANFVVSDTALDLAPPDLFTASQIIHVQPLVGHDVLTTLVARSPFVGRFYPNFRATRRAFGFPFRQHRVVAIAKAAFETLLALPAALTERLCRRAYRAYLLGRSSCWQSPEHVRLERDCLKLHTRSHRTSIEARFDDAVRAIEQS